MIFELANSTDPRTIVRECLPLEQYVWLLKIVEIHALMVALTVGRHVRLKQQKSLSGHLLRKSQ